MSDTTLDFFEGKIQKECYKIGITERDDPSLNFSWVKNIENVDAAVIISKRLTSNLIDRLVNFKEKIIFHHSITGNGSTIIEPNIYSWKEAFEKLDILIDKGFPKKQIVIRVDPIIPLDNFYNNSIDVIQYAVEKKYSRLRFSFLDLYSHVKNRFRKANLDLSNTVSNSEIIKKIVPFSNDIEINSCCEEWFRHSGCVSEIDLQILGMENRIHLSLFKQRPMCKCLPKIELLDVIRKQRCKYKCLYCYWKD